jgi:hypothetical protein
MTRLDDRLDAPFDGLNGHSIDFTRSSSAEIGALNQRHGINEQQWLARLQQTGLQRAKDSEPKAAN